MARSGKRSFNVHRFLTTEPNKYIKVSVSYNEGGANYFSGGSPARGFYMHFTPVEAEAFEGHTIERMQLFHGRKALIEETKRYNEKRILALVDQIRGECERRDPHIMRIVNLVLSEENLTLAQQELANAAN